MKHLETQKSKLYHMLLIRFFELKISEAFAYGKLAGTMFHLSVGQEATSVGMISALREGDYIQSHHRGHGHMIALGADIKKMMAEMFGRVDGYCKGKGGSMHIADIKLGNLGANGIVGAGIPIATGAALGVKYRGTDQVVMCFFGEGASLEGEFHESLNFAGLHKLPIVYVIENNQYSLSTSVKRAAAVDDLSSRAQAYNMPGRRINGMDVEKVSEAAKIAVEHARSGKGPYLLESLTYRYYGHSRSDAAPYRTKEEEEQWKAKDPIASFKKYLIETGSLSVEEYNQMEKEIDRTLEEAVAFADGSSFPDISEIYSDIYSVR
ncbi:MAG: thiamine pyrophosphate-dependent enzyme [Spirochaetota bacterium]